MKDKTINRKNEATEKMLDSMNNRTTIILDEMREDWFSLPCSRIMLETDIQTHLPRKTRKPRSSIFIRRRVPCYCTAVELFVICNC